jgi:hypothetical protein
MIEHRYALFLASDSTDALSTFFRSFAATLCGSRIKNKMSSAINAPGIADTINAIRHP